MGSKILVFAVFSVLSGVVFVDSVRTQGVIVPIPCDRRPCRPPVIPRPQPLPVALPVKSIVLDTKIVGQVATTHVEQVFRNDTSFTLEGTYFFPLPSDASIVEFAIWENGKRLAGEVRPRDEARRIYDEIVMRQRDPGLLEYAGKDLLQASIFPIPPHSDKKIELRYTQVLKADSGTVAYRYPLGTGRNLWRRVHRGPEGQRPAAPQQFGSVSGRITIEAKQPVRNIYSPTHKIESKQTAGQNSSVVTFESTDNDNDLSLFYGLGNDELGMSLLTHREPGKDGYFMLLLSPSAEEAGARRISKDIVFVLDTSGSMSDEGKMEKARSALQFGIRSLDGDDRFNVIGFAGEESLMESGLIQADAAGKRRAEEFVSKLRPSGGTNINDALEAAARQFSDSGRPGMLVFMTDGLPTVGERNVEKILENLRSAKKADIRIFPFGFGYDVNTLLLDKLGADNSGMSDYVQPKEDLEVKVSNFFERVSSPVLSDIEIDLGRLDAEMVYPRKPGDLFKGMQITMIGRYRNSADLDEAVIRLTGKVGGQSKTFRYPAAFPLRAGENEFLPRLWASRRVGWLVEQVRVNGENKELKDEMIELGLRFGLVTPYTSYLATDGSVTSVSTRAQLTDLAAAAPAKMAERTGAGAVTMSVRQNAMRTNSTIFEEKKKDAREKILVDDSENNRFFGSKNFVRRGNVWVDSEFTEGSKLRGVTVQFASRDYLELAAENPELAKYFSIGEEAVVVWRGTVYRVVK